MNKFFREIKVDTSLLKTNSDFRNLWTGSAITRFGSLITYVTMPFQLKEITHSYLAVGALGVIGIVPLIIFGLYGGALADRANRKTVVLVTEALLLLSVSVLALNSSLTHPQSWLIYLMALVMASWEGLQRPSLNAIVPRIVNREDLGTAGALESLTRSGGLILGTAFAGLLLATAGIIASYAIDIFTYAISIFFLLKLPSIPTSSLVERVNLNAILEGATYAWTRKDLLGTYLIDTAAMVFAFPNALFPFLADSFHNTSALGLLYSFGAIGSLVATATSGWTRRINRHGLAVIISASFWGLGIGIVGISHSLPLALFGLFLAGGADMVSGLFRGIIWNASIPDHLRGRMAGIEMLSYSIGPQLGEIRASVSANFFGLQRAFLSGGILCIVAVNACAKALPTLRNYDAKKIRENS